MNQDFVKGSHSIMRLEAHLSYKVKFCHKIFDFIEVKNRCEEIFREVAAEMCIEIKEIGFDRDHTHMDVLYSHKLSICQINKAFKGKSGRIILHEFPLLKKQLFWGSGLWGRQKYGDSVGRDPTIIRNYVKNQGKGRPERSLIEFTYPQSKRPTQREGAVTGGR